MRNLKHLAGGVLSTLFFFPLHPAAAQTEIAVYRPGVTAEGITYFLPRTALHVVVRAQRSSYVPGPYAPYAQRFLDVENVPLQPADSWELTSIKVVPYGVADREKAYTIRLDAKSSAPLVSLSPDGCLLAVNGKAIAGEALEQPSMKRQTFTPATTRDFKTQEMLRAGSLSAKAELTAQEIYDLRESRNLLAKGQAEFNPKDGEQLRLMLEKLDQQEEALSALFLGRISAREEHVFTFEIVPADAVGRSELFRFSRHLGVVDADDLAGTPIYIEITNLKTLPEEEHDPKGRTKKEREDLRYCNPSSARVHIFNEERTFVSDIVAVAQFGRVEHLGGVLFNKKFNTRVLLSPTTGGIEKLELESSSQ